MFFGKKKKKAVRPLESSIGKGSGKSSVSHSEIELACRDLMLASLESMRKDVISRPGSGIAAMGFDIAEKVNADLESERAVCVSDYAVNEVSEQSSDSYCAQSGAVSDSPDNSHVIRKALNFDNGKQIIIDAIAADDIRHAFCNRKETRVF